MVLFIVSPVNIKQYLQFYCSKSDAFFKLIHVLYLISETRSYCELQEIIFHLSYYVVYMMCVYKSKSVN